MTRWHITMGVNDEEYHVEIIVEAKEMVQLNTPENFKGSIVIADGVKIQFEERIVKIESAPSPAHS